MHTAAERSSEEAAHKTSRSSRYEHVLSVKPLHKFAKPKDVRQAFAERFGDPKRVRIAYDQVTKRSRLFGFIHLANEQQLKHVLRDREPLLIRNQLANLHLIEKKDPNITNTSEEHLRMPLDSETLEESVGNGRKDLTIPEMNTLYLGNLPPQYTRKDLWQCLYLLNSKTGYFIQQGKQDPPVDSSGHAPEHEEQSSMAPSQFVNRLGAMKTDASNWNLRVSMYLPRVLSDDPSRILRDKGKDEREGGEPGFASRFEQNSRNQTASSKARLSARRNLGFAFVQLSSKEQARALKNVIEEATKTGFVWPTKNKEKQYIPQVRLTMNRRPPKNTFSGREHSQPKLQIITPSSRLSSLPRRQAEWLKPFDEDSA